jgi:hypothetical protein
MINNRFLLKYTRWSAIVHRLKLADIESGRNIVDLQHVFCTFNDWLLLYILYPLQFGLIHLQCIITALLFIEVRIMIDLSTTFLFNFGTVRLFVWLMVLNATFNNISAISWRSVLLVEETRGPGESHRAVVSHWQTLSHNVVHVALIEIRTHNSVDRHLLHM